MMKAHYGNRTLIVLCAVFITLSHSVARGQDSSAQPQDGGQQPAAPAPAFGPDNSAPMTENPPLSGLDQPGLEPHAAPLSYLQPAAHISESADSNVANNLGSGNGVHSITRPLGSLEMR